MTAWQLLRAVGLVEEELLAQEGAAAAKRQRTPRRAPWLAAAACAALVCLAAAGVYLRGRAGGLQPSGADAAANETASAAATAPAGAMADGEEGAAADDPMLDSLLAQTGEGEKRALADPDLAPDSMGGMGEEIVLERSPEELDWNCPWQPGDPLGPLPVYAREAGGLDGPQMAGRLQVLAGALGYSLAPGQITILPTEEDLEQLKEKLIAIGEDPATSPDYQRNARPYQARAELEGAVLKLDAGGEFVLEFETPQPLPAACRLGADATVQQAQQAALYLAGVYGPALGVGDPQPQVSGDYSFDGEKLYTLSVRGGGSFAQQLLQYSLGGLDFWVDEEGALRGLRLWGTGAAGAVLGKYPALTEAQALEQAEAGNFYARLQDPFPGRGAVARTELVYRTSGGRVLPYYRFWARLPGRDEENGLAAYGAYYVAAITPPEEGLPGSGPTGDDPAGAAGGGMGALIGK